MSSYEPKRGTLPHLLKNGHPAHVFTDEDRRKGAQTTNRRRRLVHEAFEDEKFERQVAELLARDEAKRQKRRRRYLRDRHKRPAETSELAMKERNLTSPWQEQRERRRLERERQTSSDQTRPPELPPPEGPSYPCPEPSCEFDEGSQDALGRHWFTVHRF
jgi:hypothetical protein